MAEREKLIELKDLQITFGSGKKKFVAVDHVNFDIYKGETFSLVGESGSGKSTLMNIIGVLDRQTDGMYSLEGQDVGSMSDEIRSAIRNRRIGFVFQNFNLFPHYTVLKNITDAPVCVDKVPKEEAVERAKKLLEQLGLADKANAYPCQLSGGQQQRVSIARALALQPQILFFDEPTSALDPELTVEVLKVIKELAKQHMTMIIVTHEMQFARELSDRIIFMENGVCVQEGTPDEIFHSENERVRDFIGKFVG